MTKKWTALLLAAVLAVGLSACGTSRAEAPGSNLESGVSAIEDPRRYAGHHLCTDRCRGCYLDQV